MKLIKEEVLNVRYITEEINGKKEVFIEGIFCQAEKQNRNGRVYPMHVLQKEVERYNKSYVSQNRAFGELGHPDCFHKETEILTVSGWKKISDAAVGEQIYTLSSKGEIEIQTIEKVYNEFYSGIMYSIKNRAINTLVTPNHRFVTKHTRKDDQQFITAKELFEHRDSLRKDFPKQYIPKIVDSYIAEDKEIEIGDKSLDMSIFAPFLAIYLAEGCTIKRKGRENSYIITIFQNEGPKADQIREVLSSLPWNFRENTRRNSKGVYWKTHDNALAQFLHPLGKSYEKYIPQEVIHRMSSETAKTFLDFYILGDGRGKRNTRNRKADVFSCSERMIDDLCHIAFLAGHAIHKKVRLPEKDSKISERIIKKENKRNMYFCQLLSTTQISIDERFLKIEQVNDYNDTVHCVTVPNGTFYARDGGFTFWTGNSPTINLDRVSHMITKLYPDGNNFIGKAKILDTPNGKIVKSLLDGGASLGVSTRGVGSLKPTNGYQLVQDDFHLATAADIVADPSAPDAFVKGIMEDAEWILTNQGWKAVHHDRAKKMLREASRSDVEDVALKIFENYLSKL